MKAFARNCVPFALAAVLLALLFCLAGCGSRQPGESHWWAPSTWGKGSEIVAVDKAVKAETKASDAALVAARDSAHETTDALAVAPASRPVEVAAHSAEQTASLLDQLAGPMTAGQAEILRNRINSLVSENVATRAKAESDRADSDKALAAISDKLAKTDAALEAANVALRPAFARENAVAQDARSSSAKWWWIGGGIVALFVAVQLLPLVASAVPALAPISTFIGHIVSPGVSWVAARLRQGLHQVGVSLAKMSSVTQEQAIIALDANPGITTEHETLIRTGRIANSP